MCVCMGGWIHVASITTYRWTDTRTRKSLSCTHACFFVLHSSPSLFLLLPDSPLPQWSMHSCIIIIICACGDLSFFSSVLLRPSFRLPSLHASLSFLYCRFSFILTLFPNTRTYCHYYHHPSSTLVLPCPLCVWGERG